METSPVNVLLLQIYHRKSSIIFLSSVFYHRMQSWLRNRLQLINSLDHWFLKFQASPGLLLWKLCWKSKAQSTANLVLFVLVAHIVGTYYSSDYGLLVQWWQNHCNSFKKKKKKTGEEIENVMCPGSQINCMEGTFAFITSMYTAVWFRFI